MEFEIDGMIGRLQEGGMLPSGNYSCSGWEQQFSYIQKVEVNDRVFYFKVLKRRKDHDTEAMLLKLKVEYDALNKFVNYFEEHKNYNIPTPIYFSQEDLLLVTEEIKGDSISNVLNIYMKRIKSVDLNAEETCRKVGGFLSVFHGFESSPYSLDDLEQLIEYISERLIGSAFSEFEEEQIKKYIQNSKDIIVSEIENYQKNPVHHDLNLSNILAHNDEINVLDFGDYKVDNFFQDISCFWLMLDGHSISYLKYSHEAKKRLFKAFLCGYGIDYSELEGTRLYNLFMLKNLSIFIKTFIYRSDEKMKFGLSKRYVTYIKDKIVNSLDLKLTRRTIMKIVNEK